MKQRNRFADAVTWLGVAAAAWPIATLIVGLACLGIAALAAVAIVMRTSCV